MLLRLPGIEYARWRLILMSIVLFLASLVAEPVKTMTKDKYLEHEHVQLPNPDSLHDIAPSVRVFSNTSAPSGEIMNDVLRSANEINKHVTVTTARIIFITHGFTGSIKDEWMEEMKDAILWNSPGEIVVLVGWKKGASFWHLEFYWQAAADTQPVGRFIGDIVTQVKKRQPRLQIYGIGHSLGAHVMGKAGRYSRSFSRITGLDPAGPSFEAHNFDKRLSATDANFVDAIHSDGSPHGLWVPDHYGTLVPLGHLDFYPNWGKRGQPGCNTITDVEGCSHHKAIEYFIWSILNKGKFLCRSEIINTPTWAKIDTKVHNITRNDEMPEMGYYADTRPNKSGRYYIATNADPPYV